MPTSAKPDDFLQTIMATLRANVGPDVIDNADPGMTLRQRTDMMPDGVLDATMTAPAPSPLQTGDAPTFVRPAAAADTPTMQLPSASNQPTLKQSASTSTGSTPNVAHGKESLARWSEYTVHKVVGKGGMGQVFLAGQNALRRDVAIKKIIPEHLDKSGADQMEASFVSEALVTGYLAHPNIVPVYSLGRDEDSKWFFSMKMVHGIEWRHLLHPERCTNPETKAKALARNIEVDDPERRAAHIEDNLRILLSVCNAVAFAHSKKIIHRDLKPENIMVGEFGEVLVMDWGLAVDVSETPVPADSAERRVPTRAESGMGGTPAYMSPEQLAFDANGNYTGATLNAWTDVFLLGAMLHEILTGNPPWSGSSINAVLVKVRQCEVPTFPESVPAELAALCRKAMAKEPSARYADALEFQRAVEGYLKHRESTLIAAQAEVEGKIQEIPNLARAVILYDQALKLWPENTLALKNRENAQSRLAFMEAAAKRTRNSFRAAVAAILMGLTIGFFWIRSEQGKTEAALKEAETQKGIALGKAKDEAEQRAKTEEALLESHHQEGIAWLERANFQSSRRSHFEAAMMAANAIGFIGNGKLENSAAFEKAFPVYLKPGSPEWTEAATRPDDLTGRLLWKSGANAYVESVCYSPDGATVASAGRGDFAIRLWDVASGKEKAKLPGHTAIVFGIQYSPDGTMLVSGSQDKTVRLWDVATGTQKAKFEGHTDIVYCVAFSPDGATLASGGSDKTVRLWDVATGQEKAKLEGHSSYVRAVCFSPDGLTLASGSWDNTVRLWNISTKKETAKLEGHTNDAGSVSFSPDGATLASQDNDSVRLWDVATGKEKSKLDVHNNQFSSVSFSPDGTTVAACSDENIRLWDATTGKEKARLVGHTAFVTSVCFSPDSATIASVGWDGTVRQWEVAHVKERNKFIGHTENVACVSFSPDGATLASGSLDKTARLWDVATGREKARLDDGFGRVWNVSFSPDGNTLATISSTNVRFTPVKLWDVATGKMRVRLPGFDYVESLCFSPDGATLATGNLDGTIKLWNIKAGKEIATLSGHTRYVYSLSYSSDGATLVSTSEDKTIRLWDMTSRKEKAKIDAGTAILCANFSHDGKTLVTGARNTIVNLWDATTSQKLSTMKGHTGDVFHVIFSPDGSTVASMSEDNTIRLWDVATAKETTSYAVNSLHVPVWAFSSKRIAHGVQRAFIENKQIVLRDMSIAFNLADYLSYFNIKRDGVVPASFSYPMPYLSVNPYSHIGILQSGKAPEEINRLLFWRYLNAANLPSAEVMLRRLPPGENRDDATQAVAQAQITRLRSEASAFVVLGKESNDKKQYGLSLENQRKALAVWEKMYTQFPNDNQIKTELALALNQLAWALLTIEDAKLRDSVQALTLAQRATVLSDEHNHAHLDTLALAYFRNDKKQEARDAQRKAILQLPVGTRPDVRKRYIDRLTEYGGNTRKLWVRDGGSFENKEGTTWLEVHKDGSGTFVETNRNAEFIEIYDASRKMSLRMFEDKMMWRRVPDHEQWTYLYKGNWKD